MKNDVEKPTSSESLRRARDASNRYRIHAIDRAMRILNCFGFDHHELSVSKIGTMTGLHRSTTHRILMALEYHELVKQNPDTSKYFLGIKLFRLGHRAVSQLNLREVYRAFLPRLMNDIKENVHLAILDDDQVLYLDKVEGPHALRVPSRVGRHIPTYGTSLGEAMLSCLDDDEVNTILRQQTLKPYTVNTIKRGDQLLAELRLVRKRGSLWTTKRSRSVCVVSARLAENKIPAIGRKIMVIAGEISEKLGYEKIRP